MSTTPNSEQGRLEGVACSAVSPDGASRAMQRHTTVYIQDECLKHHFIRSRVTSDIVERPERLRAVKIGVAAGIARAEEAALKSTVVKAEKQSGESAPSEVELDPLLAALQRMKIGPTEDVNAGPPISIKRTAAKVDLLNHPAVKYVHGDVDGDVYLGKLISWARDSQVNITKKGLEIPEGLPPLDLYLCPTSVDAIQGAIGAVCEAVDDVISRTTQAPRAEFSGRCERAFVAVRPPGHHCGEDTPCGFCFVNNVVIGAAHAHLKYGIKRVVILDIDLHHGNGTQSLVWQINEETHRQILVSEDSSVAPPRGKNGLQIYYGSLHDILSFPCEDGKPSMVQAASTSIHGAHGQHIENVHLQRYASNEHFWSVLYPLYLSLLHRARDFLDSTGGPGDDVIVFISCGFDACEHEYSSMSRHGRKVPVSFYHRFTRDACALADQYAQGRLVSVLEGGYSDMALISGAMAHLCGLVDVSGENALWADEEWWDIDNLIKLQKATKNRKAACLSVPTALDAWLPRAVEIFATLDSKPSSTTPRGNWVPPSSMTLRGRNKAPSGTASDSQAGLASVGSRLATSVSDSASLGSQPENGAEQNHSSQEGTVSLPPVGNDKKLPRVILHVRPPAKKS